MVTESSFQAAPLDSDDVVALHALLRKIGIPGRFVVFDMNAERWRYKYGSGVDTLWHFGVRGETHGMDPVALHMDRPTAEFLALSLNAVVRVGSGENAPPAPPRVQWGSGNGGGALLVVLDENGRAFGWLCDEGTGSDSGPRTERFTWFVEGGSSGEHTDYDLARAALGRAAEERLLRRLVRGTKTDKGAPR